MWWTGEAVKVHTSSLRRQGTRAQTSIIIVTETRFDGWHEHCRFGSAPDSVVQLLQSGLCEAAWQAGTHSVVFKHTPTSQASQTYYNPKRRRKGSVLRRCDYAKEFAALDSNARRIDGMEIGEDGAMQRCRLVVALSCLIAGYAVVPKLK